MAIHPQGSGGLTTPRYQHLATASAIAHGIAIVSMAVFTLGALGLTRRLTAIELRHSPSEPDRLSLSAFVAYNFAIVAILIAATVSGFIVPRLFLMMSHDTIQTQPFVTPTWHIVIAAIFQFNQAFSRIYTVAASAAIILWSASALRNATPSLLTDAPPIPGLTRTLSLYGCISGAILVALIFAGHLRLDVHGMTAVVLVQAIWFLLAGSQLSRRPT
jgi:hypothetical protein